MLRNPVQSAGHATDIAVGFLKRYYYFVQPKSAKKTDDMWLVQADVGLASEDIANVEIDAGTGEIISYGFPKRPEKPA